MITSRFRKLLLILALSLPFLLPVAVSAQETSQEAVGVAVTFGIIGVVLIVLFAVAVVAAVGIGIVGIGYWMSRGDDG